jgi:hypothetical protein
MNNMKKTFLLVFTVSSLVSACSTSKELSESASEGSSRLQEETSTMEDAEGSITGGEVEITLYSKDRADKAESVINYMFYETPSTHYQDSINRMIKTYISGVVSAGGGATEQNSDLSVEFINESIDEFGDEYKRQLEFAEGGGIWQTLTTIEIHEDYPDFVELTIANWNYSGGAHGNAWSEQHFFDTRTGEKLFLEDFFKDVSELTQKAEVIFRADQEIPSDQNLEEAGFWFDDGKFELNENFAFNENSIDFMYNQYEIAPYAAGIIIVSIPMDQVSHLLKRKLK